MKKKQLNAEGRKVKLNFLSVISWNIYKVN